MIVDSTQYLTHLDVSWARLSDSMLCSLLGIFVNEIESGEVNLNEDLMLRSLGLGYNELTHSDESANKFVKLLLFILEKNTLLMHIDISGMNFKHDQLIDIVMVANQSESLGSIHLSDNNISFDAELRADICDCLSINQNESNIAPSINLPTANPQKLQNIVAEQRMIL